MTALTTGFFAIREGNRAPQVGDIAKIVSIGNSGPEVDWVPESVGAGVARQELITTENISGDQALADSLNFLPISNASVQLLLNGVSLVQGVGEEYTISGQVITWLAGTGIAPDLDTADTLQVFYTS